MPANPKKPNQHPDLAIIAKLEKQLNIKIKKIPKKEHIVWTTVGYQVGSNGQIIGLGLYNSKVKTRHLELITKLTSLTVLSLSNNQITDISSIKELTSLTYLHFISNQITDISSIEELTSLTVLDLSSNQISDISSIKELTSLPDLNLSNNQITDISSIKKLTSLTALDLSSNQITDISSIKDLILKQKGVAGWPVLEVSSSTGWERGKVTLGGNPLKTPPMEVVAQGTEAFLRWFEVKKN